jgi:Ca2+/Na+ antiporter
MVLLILVPHVVLSSLHEARVRRWPLPTRIRDFLCDVLATTEVSVNARPKHATTEVGRSNRLAFVPPLAAIVGSSVFMVDSATAIGEHWRVPGAVIGMLVLATLTGIPNLIGAIRLASQGRSTAIVSETLNSNSLNVVFGLCLPAVIIATPSPSAIALMALVFLPGLTLLGLILTGRSGGLRRTGGVALLGFYAAFVVTVVELSR